MARGKGTHGGLEVIGWHGQQEGALPPTADANQETMGRDLRGLDDDRRSLRCRATPIGFRWKREASQRRLLSATPFGQLGQGKRCNLLRGAMLTE